MRRRPTASLALIGAAALALSACGGAGATSGGATSATQTKTVDLVNPGQLTTCTQLPYQPFEFDRGGKIVGFDIDLVDQVAQDLGVPQQVVDTPFETIQSGESLNAKQCDIAAAGMTITATRKQNLDFSEPYFEATQALLTKKGSGLNSMEALAGKSLAVQSATTGQVYAQEHAPKDTQLVVFEDLGLLLTAVKTGQVDAGINDNGVLFDYVKTNPDVEVTAEFNTGEHYGFGVRKGNTAMLAEVNKVLTKIRADGTYNKLYVRWFGQEPKTASSGSGTSPNGRMTTAPQTSAATSG